MREFNRVFRRRLIHERVINLAARNHGPHRDRAVGDLLGDTHQVRGHTEAVSTKHRACATKPGDHFIKYQQDIVLVADLDRKSVV